MLAWIIINIIKRIIIIQRLSFKGSNFVESDFSDDFFSIINLAPQKWQVAYKLRIQEIDYLFSPGIKIAETINIRDAQGLILIQ